MKSAPCGPQNDTVLHALRRAPAHSEAKTALHAPRSTAQSLGVQPDDAIFIFFCRYTHHVTKFSCPGELLDQCEDVRSARARRECNMETVEWVRVV